MPDGPPPGAAAEAASPVRPRQLFAGGGYSKPLERELKDLIRKYDVPQAVEDECVAKCVYACQQFYTIGYDEKNARAALATLGGLDLTGAGVVPVASTMSVWKELSERYSERQDATDEAIASIMIERASTLPERDYQLNLHPYRQPCAVSLNFLQKNYR